MDTQGYVPEEGKVSSLDGEAETRGELRTEEVHVHCGVRSGPPPALPSASREGSDWLERRDPCVSAYLA